ncbi:MAG: DUF106 domain-containing protein [Nanoarchaeota archaeon]|nr:DUF106 domain-containing protein [Nanoarchaeota archaeon]MBU4116767.1 DUF106 domain-containing protein [Nanoarchaeota archaeon]
MDKGGSFKPVIFVMIASLAIAFFWDSITAIKETAHLILDPSAGALLNWNLTIGMLILVFIISLFITLLQKYATDQKEMRRIKKEQKELQEEMKKYKEHPEKLMSLQKKQFEFMGPMMKLSMRPMVFSGIPLILFFRWFWDFFNVLGDPKFFGFLSWFWFYLIGSMIFSMILKKVLDVA